MNEVIESNISITDPLERIEAMQREIHLLRGELDAQHRRDRTAQFQMDRLDEEMRLAAKLQRDFLPKTLPQVGQVRFHALYRPAGYVSGDLYDVMRLDEQHVGFYMADAVGHGVPAALLTMYLKRALITKQITPEGYRLLRPGESMAHLNAALIEQNLSQATFATALYGIINVNTLGIQFARGGHPTPILLTREGQIEFLQCDGSLLGIFDGESFEDRQLSMRSGDRLLVFSDGIEVAFSNEQGFDNDKWCQDLHERRHLSAEELIRDLAGRLDAESGSLEPKDDLTIIAMEAV
ncbi:MAG: SpoIIE family protein phosphatase [Phycisphaerales bacterium]|jgi:sigma-B regulation protein RsbU (phosphoserine phosphatase)|nr:SpoIIE family protein phosphatase [Phycisphaerales bacterium]